jgi:anti-anti-sigma factor
VKVDSFGVTSRNIEGGRVVVLCGELDISSTSQGLVEQMIGPPGSLVVVDLTQLTFMDSSGLSAIHSARRTMMRDGGTLVVSRPQQPVEKLLEMTGLDGWLTDWNSDWSG